MLNKASWFGPGWPSRAHLLFGGDLAMVAHPDDIEAAFTACETVMFARGEEEAVAAHGTIDIFGSLEQLHAVVEVPRAVVVLNLLAELGVPAERLAKGIAEHPLISDATQLGREYFSSKSLPESTEPTSGLLTA